MNSLILQGILGIVKNNVIIPAPAGILIYGLKNRILIFTERAGIGIVRISRCYKL
jgi:hypothetical protein